jgi:hypothetical protein
MMGPTFTLLDERSAPPLRARIGRLLAEAREADFALARIRLAVLDLGEQELAPLRRCRVLLGHLDASSLLDRAESPNRGVGPTLGPLLRFIRSGRLEVRSAGLAAWSPDFGVVRATDAATGILGTIRFGNPDLHVGPGLTVVTREPGPLALLGQRFDELWAVSHDVLPAITHVLERAHGLGRSAAPRGGPVDARPAVP